MRIAPSDPARWHLDPRREARPATPNFHLLRMGDGDAPAPIFDLPPQQLAEAFDKIATDSGATRIAGRVADGHMTYLTRSRLMGFPDYTTVLIEPAGAGSMLTGFARARFGHSGHGRQPRTTGALDRRAGPIGQALRPSSVRVEFRW